MDTGQPTLTQKSTPFKLVHSTGPHPRSRINKEKHKLNRTPIMPHSEIRRTVVAICADRTMRYKRVMTPLTKPNRQAGTSAMNKVAKAKMRNPFKSWTSGAGTTQNKTTHSVEIKVAAQAQKIPAINTSMVVLARNLMLVRPFRKLLHRTRLIAVAKSHCTQKPC